MLRAQDPAPFFEALYEDTYADTLRYLTRRCADPAQLPDLIQPDGAPAETVILVTRNPDDTLTAETWELAR